MIFEADFREVGEDNIPEMLNTFEVQIKWESNFQTEEIKNAQELIGRILELTLSFDKSIIKFRLNLAH